MKALVVLLIFASIQVQAQSLEVMVYNVENLFDSQHDDNKNDWTYLPFSKKKTIECEKIKSNYRKKECKSTDWTAKKVDLKISQIKKVVLNKPRKSTPDILGLVEIENSNVVGKLSKTLGYKKFIVSNSPDRRGIDLALLWKESEILKFISMKEHKLSGKYFEKKPSRNILEGYFKAKGKDLYVFVNHWPSLGNPDHTRVLAAKTLKARIEVILEKNPSANIIAMGDFNTIPKLKKNSKIHPFRDIFLKNSSVVDLREIFLKSNRVSKISKEKLPPGTYYYKRGKVWNQLDRVFVSKNLVDGKSIDVEIGSFDIYSPSFIRKERTKDSVELAPFRYNHQSSDTSEIGFSDHFPLIFNIKL